MSDPGGFVGLPSMGDRTQVGRVGFDQEAVGRDLRCRRSQVIERLIGEGEHPREREMEPEREVFLGISPGPGE